MNDRFIGTRSPIASKYRRVIDGMELIPMEHKNGTPPAVSSDPQAAANRAEARQSVYRQLFGPEIVNSSPVKGGADLSKVSSTFLTRASPKKKSSTTTTAAAAATTNVDDSNFVAPILYGKGGLKTVRRPLQTTPIKILDAPGLEDDFYLNLLDWEAKSNRVSVLLGGSEVYFWNANHIGGASSEEEARPSDPSAAGISSLGRQNSATTLDRGCVIKWSNESRSGAPLLALGTKNGLVEIWDAEKSVRINSWLGHAGNRCGVLSWAKSGSYEGQLSSGGRDHRIVHYDLRTARGIISQISKGHSQEVCGLKYDHYGSGLLASGGNDNQLLIWDRRKDQSGPVLELNKHTAAVKAIDWSPHQAGLLASGGGTADRTIRFWNTKLPASANISEGGCSGIASIKPIQVSSQVCTLAWSPLSPGEILSTHGFSEHNLALWSYPTGRCLGSLDGHSQRVLFQAVGPDGSTVVTGSGDETLRFWSVFRRPAASETLLNRPKTGRTLLDGNLEEMFQSSR